MCTQQTTTIPATAYGMHSWQLDAWEKQDHPSWMEFEVFRGPCGMFDGFVHPLCNMGTGYVLGWLTGRDSMK